MTIPPRSSADSAEAAERAVSAIIEAVTDGFVAFDHELRFTYVNRRAAEMWEIDPQELVGKTAEVVWKGADSLFVDMLRRVLASGAPEVMEAQSETLRPFIEMRAYPAADGGLAVFFADVTERRRAEEASMFMAEASRMLAASADYQTTLTNVATAAVPRLGDWCAVDVLPEPDSTIWPPKIERVTVVHRDPSKVDLAKNLTTRFPQDWSTDVGTPGVIRTQKPLFVADITDDIIASGAQNEAHAAMLRELHIRSLIIVPLIARGRVLGAVTLVMSESERHFTEADLALAIDLGQRAGVALDNARLLRDVAAANTAKTEFLRTISHELRQPLNAIRGYLELWKMGIRGEISPVLREDIDRISRNQQHLSALIEDLLSFTRLEAGQLSIHSVPVSVSDTFDVLDAMVRQDMQTRELDYSCTRPSTNVYAIADHDRVIQVCLNLLTNAMRATPAGGRVTLKCDDSARDVIRIAVQDTGAGIEPDQLEFIFAPFTQLGRSLNAPKEGAGLGLAISRGLAEAMKGKLTVKSAPGEGSVFSLELPRASDAERAAALAASMSTSVQIPPISA